MTPGGSTKTDLQLQPIRPTVTKQRLNVTDDSLDGTRISVLRKEQVRLEPNNALSVNHLDLRLAIRKEIVALGGLAHCYPKYQASKEFGLFISDCIGESWCNILFQRDGEHPQTKRCVSYPSDVSPICVQKR